MWQAVKAALFLAIRLSFVVVFVLEQLVGQHLPLSLEVRSPGLLSYLRPTTERPAGSFLAFTHGRAFAYNSH